MAQNCRQALQLCRLRAAKLDGNGLPLVGAGNQIVTDAAITLEFSFEKEEGADLTVKNGCGTICSTFRDCDQIKSVTLGLNLCQLDWELLAMLTGGTVLVSGGNTIGWVVPEVNAACPNGVSIEAWQKAWAGGQQASGRPFIRHGFPKTLWTPGNYTLEDGFLSVPLDGIGLSNDNFFNGPLNDWPLPGLTSMYGAFEDVATPAASCQLQPTPAS